MLRRLFSSRFKCSVVGGGEKRGTSRNAAKLIFPLPAPTFRLHRLQAKLFYSTSLLSEIPYYIHIALPVGLGRAALSTRHPFIFAVSLPGRGRDLPWEKGWQKGRQSSQPNLYTYVRTPLPLLDCRVEGRARRYAPVKKRDAWMIYARLAQEPKLGKTGGRWRAGSQGQVAIIGR